TAVANCPGRCITADDGGYGFRLSLRSAGMTDAIMAKCAKNKSNSLASIPGMLVLVGAGKMGGAMLEGWLARKLPPKKVVVLEPQPSKAIKALARRGVRINPKAAIGKAAALVIAVKPQTAPQALPPLAPLINSRTVVVSIMA